jgi:hexosaminidase
MFARPGRPALTASILLGTAPPAPAAPLPLASMPALAVPGEASFSKLAGERDLPFPFTSPISDPLYAVERATLTETAR